MSCVYKYESEIQKELRYFFLQTRFVDSTLNSREHDETNDMIIRLLMETCRLLILHTPINASLMYAYLPLKKT
jgi:hypothetical protein